MNVTRTLLIALTFGAFVTPVRIIADHRPGEKLGTVRFDVNGRPEAQEHVVRGVKLVHHMMYPEAEREFAAAAAADPACAFAYWGRAMTLIHPLWPDAPTGRGTKAWGGACSPRAGLSARHDAGARISGNPRPLFR